MWARIVEAMLGVWLILSPFIFRHPFSANAWWINDLACGTMMIVFALASYWRPLLHAHWLQIPLALWLVGFGFVSGDYPNPPALQNNMVLGLLLLMFGIIPSDASRPPLSWQKFLAEKTS